MANVVNLAEWLKSTLKSNDVRAAELRRKRVRAHRESANCLHPSVTCRSFPRGCPCSCEVCFEINSIRPEGVL